MERLAVDPGEETVAPPSASARSGGTCWHCGAGQPAGVARCVECGASSGDASVERPGRSRFAIGAIALGALVTALGVLIRGGWAARSCGCEPPPVVEPLLPGPFAMAAATAGVALGLAAVACLLRVRESAALRAALGIGIAALAMEVVAVGRLFVDEPLAQVFGLAVGPGLAAGGTLMGVTGALIALDAVVIDRGASYRRT